MRGVLSLLVLVLLLAAGFLLVRGVLEPEAGTGDGWEREAHEDAQHPDLRSEPVRPGAPGETRPVAGRDPAAGTTPAFAGVRCVVEDERGRPLPGATVRLEAFGPEELRGAAATRGERLAQATTDGNGACELALAEHRWVRVVASLAGRATAGARVAGPGTFVRLVLPAAASLEVLVLDGREAPVADVRVEALAAEAVLSGATDEAGRVRFDDVAPGPVSLTVVAADGRRARAGPSTVSANAVRRLTILLPDALTVRGIVIDAETGLPVSDAEVHVAQPGLAFAAEPTGPDGTFGPLPAGAAGSRVTLAVRAPGYAPRMIPFVLPDAGDDPDLPEVLLRRAADWSGRVVDARGRPAASARVAYTAAGIAGRAPPATRTDDSGRFTLPPPSAPAPGRRVVLTAEGTGGTAAFAFRPGDAPPTDLTLVLSGGHRATGRVVDATGAPLGGVSIRLEPRWTDIADRRQPGPETARLHALGETARLALATATDAAGWWRMDAVPDGVYDARLLHGGETDFLDEPLRVEGADADAGVVRFGDGQVLEGTVRDEAGRGLTGVQVTLREADGPPRIRRAVSEADGAWRLTGVPAGTWRLAASRPDLSPVGLTLDVPTAAPVDLELGSGARLTGQVVDAGGRPYRGVFTIALEGATPRDTAAGATFRDADGRFVLEGVPPGRWTPRVVTPDGGLGVAPAPVEVRPGTEYEIALVLGRGASVAGTLRRADGSAIVGGRVVLTADASGRPSRTLPTGAGGAFRAEGLDEGAWTVVARGPGGAPVVEHVEIGRGEERALDLVLGPVGALEVTVRGADGAARAGAYVLVRPVGSPATRPARVPRTDAAGRVVLTDVPLGPVVLEARLRSGESGRSEVAVAAGPPRSVEVRVRPAAAARGD